MCKCCPKLITVTNVTLTNQIALVNGKNFLTRRKNKKRPHARIRKITILYPTKAVITVQVEVLSRHLLRFQFPFILSGNYQALLNTKCSQIIINVQSDPCLAKGKVNCNGQCVDVKTDTSNCGQCGVVCALPNTLCENGICLPPVSCRVNGACANTGTLCGDLGCSGPIPGARTLVVSASGPPFCATPSSPLLVFTTISLAVAAAISGDIIIVCPGLYIEQVIIPSGINNLSLISQTPLAAIIQAPNPLPNPVLNSNIVTVDGSLCTTIQDFTIQGPAILLTTGIFVRNGGTANILNNHITLIREGGFTSFLSGNAINVDIGKVIISGNTIDNYQRTGIRINGLGSCAQIFNNTITGNGPGHPVAENGIQISRNAIATVTNNIVTLNQVTSVPPFCFTSSGILLFQLTGLVCVQDNNTSANQIGISLTTCTGVQVSSNISNSNQIVSGDPSCSGPDQSGIGIGVSADSTGNIISLNTALDNAGTDVVDFSSGSGSCSTGNAWLCNVCTTDNKNGCLCASTTSSSTGTPPLGFSF